MQHSSQKTRYCGEYWPLQITPTLWSTLEINELHIYCKWTVALVLLYIAWHYNWLGLLFVPEVVCLWGDTALFNPSPVSALLSTQPSRAEDTTSAHYGYRQPNKSQQFREPEVSAGCQTKLHVSSLISAMHQTVLRLILFTPESKFFLRLLSFERELQPYIAKSANLQNTWFQTSCSASQSKCSQWNSCYWGPITIAMAFNSGSHTVQYVSVMNDISPASKSNIEQ